MSPGTVIDHLSKDLISPTASQRHFVHQRAANPSFAVEHAKQVRHTQLSSAKRDEERFDRTNAVRRRQDDEHVNTGFYDQMQVQNEPQINTRDESPDQHRPGDWRGGDRMGAAGFVERIPEVTGKSKLKSEPSDELRKAGKRAKTKNIIVLGNVEIPGKNTKSKNLSKRKVSTQTRSSGKNSQRVAATRGLGTSKKIAVDRQPKYKENRQPATIQSQHLKEAAQRLASLDEPTSTKQKVISNTQARFGHISIGSPFVARNADQMRSYDDSDDDSRPLPVPRPRVIHPPRQRRRAQESGQHGMQQRSRHRSETEGSEYSCSTRDYRLTSESESDGELENETGAALPEDIPGLSNDSNRNNDQESDSQQKWPTTDAGQLDLNAQEALQSNLAASSPVRSPELNVEIHSRSESCESPRTGYGTDDRQERKTATHSSIGGWYRLSKANFARELVFTNNYANYESNPFHETEPSHTLSQSPVSQYDVQWGSLSPGSGREGLRNIRQIRHASRGTSAPTGPWGSPMVGLSVSTRLRGGGEEMPSPLRQTQWYKSMETLATQGNSSMRESDCAYEPLLEELIDIWGRCEDYGYRLSDGVYPHTGSLQDIHGRQEVMRRRSRSSFNDDPYTGDSQMASLEGIGSSAMEQQQFLRRSIQRSSPPQRQFQRCSSPTPILERRPGPYRRRRQPYPSMRGGAGDLPEGSPAPQRGDTDSPSSEQAQNIREEQACLGEIPDDAPSVTSTQPLSYPTQARRSFRHNVIGSTEQVLISDREQIGLVPHAHLPSTESYDNPSEWLRGGSLPASSPSSFQGNGSSSTPRIVGTDTHNMNTSDGPAESDLRPSSNSHPSEYLDSRDRHAEHDQRREAMTLLEPAESQLPPNIDNHLASSASSVRRHGDTALPKEDIHEPGMNDLVLPDATEPQQADDEFNELYDESPETAERHQREAAVRLALAGTSHLQSAILTNDDPPIADPPLAHRVVSLTDIPPPWFERFGCIERPGPSCLSTPQKGILTAGGKAGCSPAATPKRVTTSPDVAVFRPALEDTHNGGFMEQYPRERARLRKGKVDPPLGPRGLYLTKDDWELGRLYGRDSDDLDRYGLNEAQTHAGQVFGSRAATIVSDNASTGTTEHNEQPSE